MESLRRNVNADQAPTETDTVGMDAAINGDNGQPIASQSNGPSEDTGGTHMKRKRKPSEKGLELQAGEVRKPLKPLKSSGRSSKLRSKPVTDLDNGNGIYGDDISD
ncbi:unnamed protein product [Dovyalis caffra]|uniref:Uncharacterized protein n=1 Tax=Dovyalis caffra TaxID=77055 RepID=A0AAV1R333_9ROSI|nr:unnamed protein product [Dovyalis caffra]